jgi:hypothetical protein
MIKNIKILTFLKKIKFYPVWMIEDIFFPYYNLKYIYIYIYIYIKSQ